MVSGHLAFRQVLVVLAILCAAMIFAPQAAFAHATSAPEHATAPTDAHQAALREGIRIGGHCHGGPSCTVTLYFGLSKGPGRCVGMPDAMVTFTGEIVDQSIPTRDPPVPISLL